MTCKSKSSDNSKMYFFDTIDEYRLYIEYYESKNEGSSKGYIQLLKETPYTQICLKTDEMIEFENYKYEKLKKESSLDLENQLLYRLTLDSCLNALKEIGELGIHARLTYDQNTKNPIVFEVNAPFLNYIENMPDDDDEE